MGAWNFELPYSPPNQLDFSIGQVEVDVTP